MNLELKSIAIIRSPFCDLVDMPVQPKGGKRYLCDYRV